MPCLNASKTIAGAINSILCQTYDNWELIIVNDGSTDETEEVCRRFDDGRIQYFRKEHGGVASARNFGNSKARGIYCAVQDADDYSMPNRLEQVISAFQKTDADIIIHAGYVNGWNTQYNCPERHYLKPGEDVFKNEILGWPAYKRSIWEAKPFREETRYCYDWMMHLDWYLSGYKYYFMKEALYDYIRYAGSASDRFEKSGLRAESIKKIKEIVKQEYGRNLGKNIK